jgi:DNA-binding response OmpR family regulator
VSTGDVAVGIRDYLKDPSGRRSIRQAIRAAFDRKRGLTGEAGRVLVLDPDPLTRETVVRALQRANYHVVGIADGAEALVPEDRGRFDLLIVEASAETSRRGHLLKALRMQSPGTPLLLLSLRLGETPSPPGEPEADHVLIRPFDTRQLLRTIDRILRSD